MLRFLGFNYAYRRTVTNNPNLTPGSSMAPLPSNSNSNPPTKGSTPALQTDRPLPPHLTNNVNKTAPSTPPLPSSGKVTPKEPGSATDEKANGIPAGTSLDKSEKDRLKRERKKERKEKERAEKEATKDKEGGEGGEGSKSGKATPTSPASEATPRSVPDRNDSVSSPVDSTGIRTPTSRRPHRNPWTLFVRMQNPAVESELRDFFGEASPGVR
jgi:hypothetical protein